MSDAICPRCGARFRTAPQHAMVDERGAYCKPTCWIHRDDDVKKPCGSGRKASKVALCDKDGQVLKVYDSAKEVERIYGYDAKILRACISKGTPYRGFMWKYVKE